jgi:lycopene beta-cyclase
MPAYDFILAGGGIAGLSLAYHLSRSELRDRRILIVDRDTKNRNDRTMSFWSSRPTPFDSIISHSWSQIQFVQENFTRVFEPRDYRYNMICALDFYQFTRRELAVYPTIDFLQGTVEQIVDSDDGAYVWVDGQKYTGAWVFDSRFKLSTFKPDSAFYLQQHFKGWEIETPDDVFNPEMATLFDLRFAQHGELRFFYVLPLSSRQALIEYVLLSQDNPDQALKSYIEGVLKIKNYRILAKEGGVSPLTDYRFIRKIGQHSMTIGTLGGRIKPTSGYAFTRIQKDSAAIVRSLIQTGEPFSVPDDPRFYRFCDSLMLRIIARRGDYAKPLFTDLFEHNSIDRIFRFLDENASPLEKFLVMASLLPRLIQIVISRR